MGSIQATRRPLAAYMVATICWNSRERNNRIFRDISHTVEISCVFLLFCINKTVRANTCRNNPKNIDNSGISFLASNIVLGTPKSNVIFMIHIDIH